MPAVPLLPSCSHASLRDMPQGSSRSSFKTNADFESDPRLLIRNCCTQCCYYWPLQQLTGLLMINPFIFKLEFSNMNRRAESNDDLESRHGRDVHENDLYSFYTSSCISRATSCVLNRISHCCSIKSGLYPIIPLLIRALNRQEKTTSFVTWVYK